MKKIVAGITISIFLLGCNINPNKEARIQKLEKEIQAFKEQMSHLEKRLKTLEQINTELKSKLEDIEGK